MSLFLNIAVFCFGTVIGSFLNVVILRLPKGQLLNGRSHCPHCGHELTPLELVPMVSYLALGGKCRQCKAPISVRYFLIEALTGLLFLTAWLVMGPITGPEYLLFFRALFAVSVLLVVFVVDLENYLILDKVIFPAVGTVMVVNLVLDILLGKSVFSLSSYLGGGLVAAVLAALPFFLLWYFSQGLWMGFGDVKFMFFMGLTLGWPTVWVGWGLAFVLGALLSLPLLAAGKKKLQSKVPFGIFLSVATFIALFWGQRLLDWYLSFLGI